MLKMNKENSNIENLKDFLITEKEKKKSYFQIYLDTFKESCTNSTSHGIPHIARSESWPIRIFWFILLIGAAISCIYCRLQYIFIDIFNCLILFFIL